MMIEFALGSALTIVANCLYVQTRSRRKTLMAINSMSLRPNCLMTQKPLVFLSGPRSIFQTESEWFSTVHFLREHGLEVFETSIQSRTDRGYKKCLETLKRSFSERGCYLIAGSHDSMFLKWVSRQIDLNFDGLATLNEIDLIPRHRLNNKQPLDKGRPIATDDLAPARLASRSWPIHAPFVGNWLKSPLFLAHSLMHLGHVSQSSLRLVQASAQRNWPLENQILDLAIEIAESEVAPLTPHTPQVDWNFQFTDLTP